MITDRDKLIIKHLEEYKYTTIEHLEKIFFKEQQYSYNIARKRLGAIKNAGYVKIHRDVESNRNIYMWNEEKIKPPSQHRLIVLNVLAELHYIGLDVKLFDIEKQWMNGKVRSDGFTICTLDSNAKNKYHFFIEVHVSNNYYNLKKYDELYKTREVQNYLGKDFFPRVLLITDRDHEDLKLEHTKVLTLNTKLKSFASILLPQV